MPSRIVRDGILESESVNLLSWEAELFGENAPALRVPGKRSARPDR